MFSKSLERGLLWSLVLFSIGSLIFTPFHALWDSVLHALPWLGTGVIVTEAMFIGGLCIMAASMGIQIRNPFALRKELKNILREGAATQAFWTGFWVNALGACGSSVLLGAGICITLPITSWGLLWIPAADLAVTASIRKWALRSLARERALS